MAPTATSNSSTLHSAVSSLLQVEHKDSPHPAHLHHLATSILHNLQYYHNWTHLVIHTHSPVASLPLPRPLVSGLPPKRAYIHEDEQAEMVKAEHESGKKIEIGSELEWVLPAHLTENWSLAKFAAVFDAISIVPPTPVGFEEDISSSEELVGQRWRGDNRPKRMLLATMHDDSTVVYYVLHDGIVKPRQN